MPRPSAASLSPSHILSLLETDELADLTKQFESQGGTTDGLLGLAPGRLLREIAMLRLPFIRMMNDVAAMLDQIEAGLKGNVRFIVLPDLVSELKLDFGPQLRGAVSKALSPSFLTEHSGAINKRLHDLERQVRSVCKGVKPMPVERKDELGSLLDERAAMTERSDPAGAFRDRFLSENMFTHQAREYNPTDMERLRALNDAVAQLVALTNKMLAASSGLGELAAGLKEGVERVAGVLQHKIRSGPISHEYPHPRRAVDDRRFSAVAHSVQGLREAVHAASEYADAMDDLYDFLNLHIWRQRWRVYELWVLARVLHVLIGAGAVIADKSRVVGGTWQIKFTNDSSPVLGLGLNGQLIELYYQLYQERGSTGDMPDLAVRVKDGRFVAVIDPKHGYSYSRQDLNDVCKRYADAFQPFLSCVCNYFPVRETEEVGRDPLSLVLYDFNPDSAATTAKFESELSASLALAFRELGSELPRIPGVIVLFDVSNSASHVRPILMDAFKAQLARVDPKPRADSRALIFSTHILREGSLEELASQALLQGQFHGGTDFEAALRSAVARLSTLPRPTELWMFTDGQGAGAMRELATEVAREVDRFVVFEAENFALRTLATAAGGRHIELW